MTARAVAPPQITPEPLRQSPPASSVTVALPTIDGSPGAATTADARPANGATPFPPAPDGGSLAPARNFPMLPWLLAAIAVAAGAGFLFWRNRHREAFAGGPQVDAFTAPDPVAQPRPVPRASPPPQPRVEVPPAPPPLPGLVSTRLRPWIDIGFQPTRCVLEDETVTIDFDLELFNSGSAPARAVLAEASVFSAGPEQDAQVGAFFANPVGAGERIVAIPSLQRVAVRTRVTAPRNQLLAYELGGHQVFVPIVAFNVLYGWGGSEGQTSVSYLVGRDAKGDKLGPFRLDLGPRIFRGLGGRLLPSGVRR